ncbi:MAG TPA: FtsX-like permease family protein [Thermoanaerobaculia bacterium]|nr:FtsX-like permease family protein [Thermoanaerobaculia bacterium]
MRFYQALSYFVTEAFVSLARSWKVSVAAIAAIGVSLFLCGAFLVVFRNLSRTVAQWQQEVAVVVYLPRGVERAQVEDLRFVLDAPVWVRGVVEVDAAAAADRFEETFPRLAELARTSEGDLFPPSLEAEVDPAAIDDAQFEQWIEGLRAHPAALMVDADQEWLDQLASAVRLVRAGGIVLGVLLVGAAALTTSSLLRLIAHAHREEIAIMRMVGATEFYIRGPFYFEGLLQGVAGAAIAIAGIVLGSRAIPDQGSFVTALLLAEPARLRELGMVLGVGALIGMSGAVLSLRGERGEAQVIE